MRCVTWLVITLHNKTLAFYLWTTFHLRIVSINIIITFVQLKSCTENLNKLLLSSSACQEQQKTKKDYVNDEMIINGVRVLVRVSGCLFLYPNEIYLTN